MALKVEIEALFNHKGFVSLGKGMLIHAQEGVLPLTKIQFAAEDFYKHQLH